MKTITANIKEGIDQEIITEAGSILKDGGLVAFPTETVYGPQTGRSGQTSESDH